MTMIYIRSCVLAAFLASSTTAFSVGNPGPYGGYGPNTSPVGGSPLEPIRSEPISDVAVKLVEQTSDLPSEELPSDPSMVNSHIHDTTDDESKSNLPATEATPEHNTEPSNEQVLMSNPSEPQSDFFFAKSEQLQEELTASLVASSNLEAADVALSESEVESLEVEMTNIEVKKVKEQVGVPGFGVGRWPDPVPDFFGHCTVKGPKGPPGPKMDYVPKKEQVGTPGYGVGRYPDADSIPNFFGHCNVKGPKAPPGPKMDYVPKKEQVGTPGYGVGRYPDADSEPNFFGHCIVK